jgi:hypothetical protein
VVQRSRLDAGLLALTVEKGFGSWLEKVLSWTHGQHTKGLGWFLFWASLCGCDPSNACQPVTHDVLRRRQNSGLTVACIILHTARDMNQHDSS